MVPDSEAKGPQGEKSLVEVGPRESEAHSREPLSAVRLKGRDPQRRGLTGRAHLLREEAGHKRRGH